MSPSTLPPITEEDKALWGILKELARHNGLTGYSDNFIPARFTDLNYVPPNSGEILFVTNIVLVAVACIFVAARYYAKAFIAGGLGADDVAIGISTVLFIGSTSSSCYAVRVAGFGRHVYDLDLDYIPKLLGVMYAMPIVYNLEVFFIKLSILLFCRRLFGPDRTLQRIVKALIFFQALYTIAYCIVLAFICKPVYAWWTVSMREDHCPDFLQTMIIYISLRSVSVFTDVLVLCLPMKILWDLKIPLRQKAGLVFVFGLGILTCLASILRLAYIPKLLLNLDVSWNIIPVAMLDVLEQSLGIITASLPALTAIIAKFRGSIDANKPEHKSTPLLELSKPGNLEANYKNSDREIPGPEFDFLSLAYDPDNTSTVISRAWASGPRLKKREGLGRIIGKAGLGKPLASGPSNENLVDFHVDPFGISKTTTVEIIIDKRL